MVLNDESVFIGDLFLEFLDPWIDKLSDTAALHTDHMVMVIFVIKLKY